MQTVTRARKTKATNKKGAADLDSGPWVPINSHV